MDLISRQAAIRWVKTECNPYGNPTLDFESGKKVIEHLEQMPSAQPKERTEKRTETHACDLIDREEAKWVVFCHRDHVEDQANAIDELPSVRPPAQPERKKGKWSFIGDNMFECTCCGTPYTTQQLNGLRNYNTDPYAPKFCPNCGADMRGEQDESKDA